MFEDGKWIAITALPDQLVVNVGDMLDRLTNHKLKSTIHRVVNPPRDKMGNSRFSIPFFMHPRSEMDLKCLDSCVSDEFPKLYGLCATESAMMGLCFQQWCVGFL